MTVTTENSPMLDRFVQRARTLYSLPPVAAKVLQLTAHADVEVDALAECIERDPALTAKILGVVNSSQYGLGTSVTSLQQALTLLGTRSIKLLVLGFSLPVELTSDTQAEMLDGYWRHTLLKAVAARELSETLWKQAGDEAFVAGLLQDIGTLALIRELGPPYADFLGRVRSEGGNLPALELATLGFDHAILSARLLEHWGLPESIVKVIALPHDCDRLLKLPPDEGQLAQVLHVAELLAELLAEGRESILPELLQVSNCYRQITEQQLESLVATVDEKVRQLTESLSVDVTLDDCQRLLINAHTQLAATAAGVAARLPAPDDDTQRLWDETRSLSQSVARFAEHQPHANQRSQFGAASHPASAPTRTRPPNRPSTPAAAPRPPVAELDSVTPSCPNPVSGAALVPVLNAPGGKDDPVLLDRLAAAVAACRNQRTALSLLLVEIDHYRDLCDVHGRQTMARLVRFTGASSAGICDEPLVCVKFGDGRLALILEDCDRHESVTAARRLVERLRERRCLPATITGPNVTLSVGVATVVVPACNFPAGDLLLAAERCLSGVQSSGGDGVKSIDIY